MLIERLSALLNVIAKNFVDRYFSGDYTEFSSAINTFANSKRQKSHTNFVGIHFVKSFFSIHLAKKGTFVKIALFVYLVGLAT